ncbi:MAG: carboxypeptidase-like regulatory domain-containing protein [Gemmatimonadaceae bacterium]
MLASQGWEMRGMKTAVRVFLVLFVSSIVGRTVCAQQGASFRGRVTDSIGTALDGVEVSVVEAHLTARTESAGTFAIRNIPAGTYHMVLRLPGFGPIAGTGRFADGDSIDMNFRMRRLMVALDTVRTDTSRIVS